MSVRARGGLRRVPVGGRVPQRQHRARSAGILASVTASLLVIADARSELVRVIDLTHTGLTAGCPTCPDAIRAGGLPGSTSVPVPRVRGPRGDVHGRARRPGRGVGSAQPTTVWGQE